MRNVFRLLVIAVFISAACNISAKKPLDHDSFDGWEKVTDHSLSPDGAWASYSVNPQEGDGTLYLRSTSSKREILIPRGYDPVFTADSRRLIAKIKPLYQDTRKAKIDKKKDFDLPQDSLVIVELMSGDITRIPRLSAVVVPENGSGWIAYTVSDTCVSNRINLKDKEVGLPMVVRRLATGDTLVMPYVKEFVMSKDGTRLAAVVAPEKKDSVMTSGISVFNLPKLSSKDGWLRPEVIALSTKAKLYGVPVFSEDGSKLAFTETNDSNDTGTRRMRLMLSELSQSLPVAKELDVKAGEKEGLYVNQYSTPKFSYDGRRLVIGVAGEVAPDDTTLVSFERPELDIWRWDAPYTPPQELTNKKKIASHTMPVVIDLASGHQQLLTDNPLVKVDAPDRWDADWALLHDPTREIVSQQWNYYAPEDLKIVNVISGESRDVATVYIDSSEISPDGKFVYWFKDGQWFAYEIASGHTVCMTESMPYPVWDEADDHPGVRQPYGDAGWGEGDARFLVYDRHDIWSVDPRGEEAPVCLTAGYGRDNGLKIRYVNTLGRDRRALKPGDLMTLTLFDYADKRNGIASMKYGKAARPSDVVLDTFSFTQIRQAKDAPSFSFVKGNFSVMPNVWLAPKGNFPKAYQVSDANPQQKDYWWGTARLEHWYAYDGTPSDGVLYVPEDFDPSRKYPMLCVFYETGSEDLYTHYNMEPSWSWVNYPFYVSRGYVIFVPDIHYKAGVPGECAWNFVCSGAEAMCDRYPWIDRERIGIDGQSWGGYQTAYLVTRTDMFACAGSGAPVSNMTSAFGGIRWESGDSRQGQYELGQSRIGRNLWDATELYVANSPVFHANRVHTPLLIMHNDNDGAVPWYQGIEMFMALRRLGKPVWMLQYNGEAHNLRERRNRKDITVRLQQFFDHYLKGDTMPEWMKSGIPVTRKGQELGY